MSELSPKLTPRGPGGPMADLTGLEKFNSAFGEYMVWNKRDQGKLIADRGRKLSIAIFKIYRKTAEPNRAALRAKIFAETGYNLKRRLILEGPRAGKAVSWAEEIKLRANGVALLATSWLQSRWGKNQAQGRFLRVNRQGRRMGEVIVDTQSGNPNPSVQLISYLQGAVALNQQRALVSQALYYQAADMASYIARKHQEKLTELFRAPFVAAISA